MKHITIQVTLKDLDTRRLDKFLQAKYHIPFTLVQKLIRKKDIKVNHAGTNCNYLLQEQDIILIKNLTPLDILEKRPPSKKLHDKLSELIQKNIIFKDDYIIAINKPYDIAVQGGNKIHISIDDVLKELKFGYQETPRLVHRLDKQTSGLLIIARTTEVAQILMKLFQEKQIQKKYIAIVSGNPTEQSGILTLSIKKNTFGNLEKMSASSDGKESITEYRVIRQLSDKASLVEFKPLTGRTHQIRVHTAELLNCPILGDIKYGGKAAILDSLTNKNKLHLAAQEIQIPNIKGQNYEIECPLPEHITSSIIEIEHQQSKK